MTLHWYTLTQILVLIVAPLLWSVGDGPYADNGGPFLIEQGGKYGYIDRTGRVIIAPQFDAAWRFAEGLAFVRVASKFGYIDRKGTFVIKPQFDNAMNFSEGLAAVRLGSNWGYIDREGSMVVPPRYQRPDFDPEQETTPPVHPFSNGLAMVETDDGGAVYIDRTGHETINVKTLQGTRVTGSESFAEGLAGLKLGGRWGWINKQGEIAISPQFDSVRPFADGLAAIKVGDNWGFVDKNGRTVIQPRFDYASRFSDGVSPVRIAGRWGYIDKTGKLVVELRFDVAEGFSAGLAAVRIDNKWGFVDLTGRVVIPPKYNFPPEPFSGALALIRDDEGQLVYIDRQGNSVWRSTR